MHATPLWLPTITTCLLLFALATVLQATAASPSSVSTTATSTMASSTTTKAIASATASAAIKKASSPLGMPFQTQSPWLFAVYHLDHYPKGKPDLSIGASVSGRNIGMDFGNKDWNMYHGRRVPGFPRHPHRGFETVTVCRRGMVDHTDSLGCEGRYGDGDTQWMTAGTGLEHCEMFPQMHTDKPNTLDLFQLWLNLPRRSKHATPAFKMMWGENAVHYTFPSDDSSKPQAFLQTVAGPLDAAYGGGGSGAVDTPPKDSWAADPNNYVAIWMLRLQPGASWLLPPAGSKDDTEINRSLIFFKGSQVTFGSGSAKGDTRTFNEHTNLHMHAGKAVLVSNTGKSDDVELLMLQGRPIDEPVVKHGPFVMNSQAEIAEAFNDYRRGKFGSWPFDKDGPTHDPKKGRFALYADGREDFPPAKKQAAAASVTVAADATVATAAAAGGAGGGAGV